MTVNLSAVTVCDNCQILMSLTPHGEEKLRLLWLSVSLMVKRLNFSCDCQSVCSDCLWWLSDLDVPHTSWWRKIMLIVTVNQSAVTTLPVSSVPCTLWQRNPESVVTVNKFTVTVCNDCQSGLNTRWFDSYDWLNLPVVASFTPSWWRGCDCQ